MDYMFEGQIDIRALVKPKTLFTLRDEYHFVGYYIRIVGDCQELANDIAERTEAGKKIFPLREKQNKLLKWIEEARLYLPDWYKRGLV